MAKHGGYSEGRVILNKALNPKLPLQALLGWLLGLGMHFQGKGVGFRCSRELIVRRLVHGKAFLRVG